MRTDPRFYRRSHTKRLMHATEVVPRVPERDHVRVVLKLLTEGVGEPGEAAHTHSHVQVLALDVRSRDVLGVRAAGNCLRDCTDTSRGAVSSIRFKIPAVDLNQRGVVDATAERILDSGQVYILWPSVVNWIRLASRDSTS
jgi:hypothetical protein